jgi:hypothetical protein
MTILREETSQGTSAGVFPNATKAQAAGLFKKQSPPKVESRVELDLKHGTKETVVDRDRHTSTDATVTGVKHFEK